MSSGTIRKPRECGWYQSARDHLGVLGIGRPPLGLADLYADVSQVPQVFLEQVCGEAVDWYLR